MAAEDLVAGGMALAGTAMATDRVVAAARPPLSTKQPAPYWLLLAVVVVVVVKVAAMAVLVVSRMATAALVVARARARVGPTVPEALVRTTALED